LSVLLSSRADFPLFGESEGEKTRKEGGIEGRKDGEGEGEEERE
jgi:hypothetical protein